MKKKLMSLVLSLAMIVSLFTGMTITASAEDEQPTPELNFYLSDGTTPVNGTNVLKAYSPNSVVYEIGWEEMPTLVSGLTVKIGSEDPVNNVGSFELIWTNKANGTQSDRPDADDQPFTVVFNGTIGEVEFENVPVTSGTVRVRPRFLELEWYDLVLAHTGQPQLPTIVMKPLTGDEVTVGTYTIVNEDGEGVSEAVAPGIYTMTVETLGGADARNYSIDATPHLTEEFTIEKIKMKIDGVELTADNILDNYDTRVYGDTWFDMPDLREDDIVATLAGETCDSGSYRLVWENEGVTDIPEAGEQGYKVLFTGTLLGVEYEDAVIFTGSIEVEKRNLTIGVADGYADVRGEMPEPGLYCSDAILIADWAKIVDIIGGATVSVASDETSAPADFAISWDSFAADKTAIDAELANNYDITYITTATMHVIYDTCLIRFVDDESSTEEIEYWSHGGQYTLPSKTFFRAPYLQRFAAWDIEGEQYGANAIYTVTKDVTVEVRWEDIVVTGDIDKNALIYDAETGIYTLPENEETAPEGKRFGGWLVNNSLMPAGAVVDVNVDLDIVHFWESPEYTLTFEAHDTTGRSWETEKFFKNHVYTLPGCDFEPLAGKEFLCWVINGESKEPGETVVLTDDLIVQASWVDKYVGFTVSGSVVDMNSDPVEDAIVEAWLGSEMLESTTTDLNGNYVFSTIQPGIYNFVVTKGDATTTVLKEIGSNGNAGVIRIDLGDLEVNLTVESGTPTTAVGGLDEEAQKIKDTYPADYSVTVEMTVEATEPGTTVRDEIEDLAKNQSENLTYIDIDINKLILAGDGSLIEEGEITETDDLLKIVIEFETEGRRNFAVYRYHEDHEDGDVQKLVKSKDLTKERIEVGDGVITLYVKYFSTYAIGYSEGSTGGGGSYVPETPSEPEDDGECKRDDTCPLSDYVDLSTTAWYHDAVHYCIDNGLMNGYGIDFRPDGAVTRQQVWMMLARLSGENPANMAQARAWAVANGVSDGTNPTNAVTRQQFITMLYRYAQQNGYDVSSGEDTNILSYTDAFNVSEYAIAAMQWGCAEGIMGGYSDGSLKPANGATRAHVAAFLQRFCEGA